MCCLLLTLLISWLVVMVVVGLGVVGCYGGGFPDWPPGLFGVCWVWVLVCRFVCGLCWAVCLRVRLML